MSTLAYPSRRALLAAGFGLAAAPAFAQSAPAALRFAVFRNGVHVGEHRMTFAGNGADLVARTEVAMTIKLGPVPVYRYRHTATERWRNGRFASLATSTVANGKSKRVVAEAGGSSVAIDGPAGKLRAAAGASPLTHWNTDAFAGPLFNPQEGGLLRVRARQAAPGHWTIRGEVEIDNFYDGAGAWKGLTGKLEDGSRMEYRRT